jgi:hypothetical protein
VLFDAGFEFRQPLPVDGSLQHGAHLRLQHLQDVGKVLLPVGTEAQLILHLGLPPAFVGRLGLRLGLFEHFVQRFHQQRRPGTATLSTLLTAVRTAGPYCAYNCTTC